MTTDLQTMAAPKPDRTTYIGGSDTAAIIGVSEWKTQLGCYFQKRGEPLPADLAVDHNREKRFRRGRLMEPVVIEMLIAEHPIKVTKRSPPENPNRYIDREHAFIAAEIDFEWEVTPEIVAHFAENGVEIDAALIGTTQNGEVKSAHPFVAMKKFGEEGTDEIPIEYAAQAMHGLMVTGRQLTIFPVLVGSDDLIIYWVKRDDATIEAIRAKEVSFWRDHVLPGVPPAAVNLPDVFQMFRRRAASAIDATAEIAAAVTAMRMLSSRKTVAEEGIEALKFEIGDFMLGAKEIADPKKKGVHVLTFQGDSILELSLQEQARIDSDELRLKFPDAAEACSKTTSLFVFRKPAKRRA